MRKKSNWQAPIKVTVYFCMNIVSFLIITKKENYNIRSLNT